MMETKIESGSIVRIDKLDGTWKVMWIDEKGIMQVVPYKGIDTNRQSFYGKMGLMSHISYVKSVVNLVK